MRIGVSLGVRGRAQWTVPDVTEQWKTTVDRGLDSAWLAQGIGADALTLIGAVGPEPASPTELGIAVVPVQTRHVMALAQQVATVIALGKTFTLGIGLGHRELLGPQYGITGPRRIDWLIEYLDVLTALLEGEEVDHQGLISVRAQQALPPVAVPEILLAALGPRMLALAGERAAGTIVWRTGPTALARDVVPIISESAERHGRPAPRIVVGLPFAVTDDRERALEYVDAAEAFSFALPSYRDAYEREGVNRPSDIALVGDEDTVRQRVAELAAAGATDFVAVLHDVGDVDRTWALLADLAKEARAT